MKIIIFLSLLLCSSALLAASQNSSIHAKNIEMKAEREATAIIQTGNGRIIGETGSFIKDIYDQKPKVIPNSSISATENLTIKATEKGVVIVQTGNGTIVYQANKKAVARLGVAEKSLASFFAILQVENVPLQDWNKKLKEIAESYTQLKEELAAIKTTDEDLINLKDEISGAIDTGQYKKAKSLLRTAKKLAMDSKTEDRLIIAAEFSASEGNLAAFLLQFIEAGNNFEDAANKVSALGEDYSEQRSQYLTLAGKAFYMAGEYNLSLPIMEKALNLRENNPQADHIATARSLNNLAMLYHAQGEYQKAFPLCKRALNLREQYLDKNHLDITESLNNLGLLYQETGQYENSLPLFEKSLKIKEKTLDKDDPDLAVSYNNLALTYQYLSQINKALPLYEKAIEIEESLSNFHQPELALTLNNLAGLYISQQEYNKALPLLEKSVKITEENLGKDHPSIANTLNNLAGIYVENEENDKAEFTFKRALSISEENLGKSHQTTAQSLNGLAALYYREAQYSKALPFAEQALSIVEENLGKDHPNTRAAQQNYDAIVKEIKE